MSDVVINNSIASEYLIWYQRIYTYLATNTKVCAEIEKETGLRHLADLFDVTGGELNKKKVK